MDECCQRLLARNGSSEVGVTVRQHLWRRAWGTPYRGHEPGAAAVEFALVVPLLLMLVFGIIDFGVLMHRNTLLDNAAREGVRAASLGRSESDVRAVVQAALPGASVTVTVSCLKPDGSACASYAADAASGGTAVVRVDYAHHWLTPVGPMFGGSTRNLTQTSRMRIE
jgi:Flp pilus assembly protein TadG